RANSAKYDLDPESLMRRWRLDDQQVAYPMYELIVRNAHVLKAHPGFFNICIHKGLSTTAPNDPALGFPVALPPAAQTGPMLNFVIYHSCIRPGFWMLNALNDVRSGRLREGVPDILWVLLRKVSEMQVSENSNERTFRGIRVGQNPPEDRGRRTPGPPCSSKYSPGRQPPESPRVPTGSIWKLKKSIAGRPRAESRSQQRFKHLRA